MPTLRTPLAGSYNNRGDSASDIAKGQYFKGCVFQSVINQQTNTKTVYTQKRYGIQLVSATGSNPDGVISSLFDGYIYSSAGTPSTIYKTGITTTSIGTFAGTGRALHFSESVLGSVGYILITANDYSGWYVASDAVAQTAYTVTTHTNITVDGIASTAGMYVGQLVTKSDIPSNTRIASVDSANQITITQPATGSSTGTLTKTPLAKIIDADFPTDITGAFVELDGTFYIMTLSGNIRGSEINSVSSWVASNSIAANTVSDYGVGLAKYKNKIVAFGASSAEWFFNAGNPSGSLLSRDQNSTSLIGALRTNYSNSPAKALINAGLDQLFWISPSSDLYRLNGGVPERISPSFLNLIACFNLDIFPFMGRTIVSIGCNHSKWYIIEEKSFVEPFIFNLDYTPAYISYSQASAIFSGQLVLVAAVNTGINIFSTSDYRDVGNPFTMSIQIQTDMGTNFRKFIKEMRIEADVQASGNLAVSYSDDDGATYSAVRNISMTNTRMRLPRLGSFVGSRLWKFEHSDNTPCRIKSIEFDYEIGKR